MGERKWERANLTAEPRSAYLLNWRARSEWEHSIPPVDALRYSITFRNLREGRMRHDLPTVKESGREV